MIPVAPKKIVIIPFSLEPCLNPDELRQAVPGSFSPQIVIAPKTMAVHDVRLALDVPLYVPNDFTTGIFLPLEVLEAKLNKQLETVTSALILCPVEMMPAFRGAMTGFERATGERVAMACDYMGSWAGFGLSKCTPGTSTAFNLQSPSVRLLGETAAGQKFYRSQALQQQQEAAGAQALTTALNASPVAVKPARINWTSLIDY